MFAIAPATHGVGGVLSDMPESKRPHESSWWAVGMTVLGVVLIAYFVWAMQGA
jgi:hypothetical protein